MEVCESGGEQPPLLHWDRKLSELCEPADPDTLLCHTVILPRAKLGYISRGGLPVAVPALVTQASSCFWGFS